MSRAATLVMLLLLASGASVASAQERVVASLRVDAWDRADLSWATPPDGAPLRVVVRGTLTNALDGAEIDATQIATPSRAWGDASPLVFPQGTQLIEARGQHEYLFAVPPGQGATISLNTMLLAGRLLVTASEVRNGITGAIFVDVLAWEAAPTPALASLPGGAPAQASLLPPFALAGGAMGLPLLALGLFIASRRRASREDAAMKRAKRAQRAILREARALGPAFDGALASAQALIAAAEKQRSHLREIDGALARTAWVETADASAGQAALRHRRDEGVTRLEAIVAQLEDTVVRMAACVADRSALAGLERDLARMKSEVEVGESVEQELASIERR